SQCPSGQPDQEDDLEAAAVPQAPDGEPRSQGPWHQPDGDEKQLKDLSARGDDEAQAIRALFDQRPHLRYRRDGHAAILLGRAGAVSQDPSWLRPDPSCVPTVPGFSASTPAGLPLVDLAAGPALRNREHGQGDGVPPRSEPEVPGRDDADEPEDGAHHTESESVLHGPARRELGRQPSPPMLMTTRYAVASSASASVSGWSMGGLTPPTWRAT